MSYAFNPGDDDNTHTSRVVHTSTAGSDRKWFLDDALVYAQDMCAIHGQFREAIDDFANIGEPGFEVEDDEDNDEVLEQLIYAARGHARHRNLINNGNLEYWPDGAGPFTSTGLTAGLVRLTGGGGSANSITRIAGLDDHARYALQWDRTVVGSSNNNLQFRTPGVMKLSNKTLYISITDKTTSGTKDYNVNVMCNFGTGGSPSAAIASSSLVRTVTTTAERWWGKILMPDLTDKTFGTNDDHYFGLRIQRDTTQGTGIIQFQDVWLGAFARTPWAYRSPGLERKRIAEQYVKMNVRTKNGTIYVSFPTEMRAIPTITLTNGSASNISKTGFELTHSLAADCTVTANAAL